MLTEICADICNYFPPHFHGHETGVDVKRGHYIISGGAISPLDFVKVGQYFRIVGSGLNDGVHQKTINSLTELKDEEFDGDIWVMSIPSDLLALNEEIEAFCNSNKTTPFSSESFGGYSYTIATDRNGNSVNWKTAFSSQLNRYRRIHI